MKIMKKIMILGFMLGAFLFITPGASAQNAEQAVIWDQAKAQTEALAEKIDLDDNQKAYMTRHLYNYQDRVDALDKNYEHFSFKSKEEISERLDEEVKMVLNESQFTTYKNMKSDLLKVKSSK